MNDLVPEVGWLVAFGAGVLSFLSPCVVPLVPGYLSYISGVSVHEMGSTGQTPSRTIHVLASCLLFVAGFSLVFVLLGASASLFGDFLQEYRRPLNRAAGVVMVLMGVFLIGLIRLPQLMRERRFHLTGRSFGRGGTVLLGMAFAFVWTPCVGPILASILFYAGSAETALRGALLLLIYSLGMGVPFVLTGLGFSRAVGALNWVKRHHGLINAVSGSLLVGVGLLFLTDRFYFFSIMAQRLYYSLFY